MSHTFQRKPKSSSSFLLAKHSYLERDCQPFNSICDTPPHLTPPPPCRDCHQEGSTGLPACTINLEEQKVLQGPQRDGSQSSYALGWAICMERSTAPLYWSWFEYCSQICGSNRSSSSCLPSRMFGGWKATHYLRLWYFPTLKTFFQYAFHTESPEHKARRQKISQRHHGLSAASCSGSVLSTA